MQPTVSITMLYENMFDELRNDHYAIILKYTRNNILFEFDLCVSYISNVINDFKREKL